MSVATLAGTTWQFDQTIDCTYLSDFFDFDINFVSNNQTYKKFSVDEAPYFGLYYTDANDSSVFAYNDDTSAWRNSNYRTIEITGGSDASNSDLILFVENQATLLNGVSKVVYDNNTLIDLTNDDVTAADVVAGKSFHMANGLRTIGTASYVSSSTTTTLTVGSSAPSNPAEGDIWIDTSSL